MKTGEARGQAFIVAGEPTETARPGKGTFHDPASGQEHKTALGLFEFDDHQLDAVGRGFCRGLFARVTLVGESDFDL